MPKSLSNITLVWNMMSGNFDLAPNDFQTLQQNLILTANPDGTIVEVPISGQVYNAQVLVAADQAQVAADQTKLATDTAAEQDINP